MSVKNTSLALMVWLLASCSSYVKPVSPEKFSLAEDSQTGYVVGSLSYQGNHNAPDVWDSPHYHGDYVFDWYKMRFHQIDGDAKGEFSNTFQVWPLDGHFKEGDGDFLLEEGAGYIFVIPIKAGSYNLDFWDTTDYPLFYSSKELVLSFEVIPGMATYLGELRFSHSFDHNDRGDLFPLRPELTRHNEKDRDLALIYKKYPLLNGIPLASTPPYKQQP